jgi:purine nucleosidase
VASLVIDTDTASDDAVAIMLAARTPGVTIRAITMVAGNVPLDLAARNALITLETLDHPPVPVHLGAHKPLMRPLETAQVVHGEDGMGDIGLRDPERIATPGHAVDVLRHIADTEPGQHVLVTLGPLTNIAMALFHDPLFLTKFQHVYSMVGAFDAVGNIHVVGEYNAWADPEAAAVYFSAVGAKTCIGWDAVRRYAVFEPEEQAALGALGPLGAFANSINVKVTKFELEVAGLPGYTLPDPLAMAVAVNPSIATRLEPHHVTVSTEVLSRGGTFVDHRAASLEPNATIAWDVDEDAFKAMLSLALST